MDNPRPGGALWWKGETAGWKGRGDGMWKGGTSKAVAPPVSVNDLWVGPHEQVSNVPIVYWWHGPSKRSSLSSTDAYLYPHYFKVGSREKLYTDPWIGQPTRCGLCQEPFLSGAVTLLNFVDDSWKVATYGDYLQEAYAEHTWTSVGNILWKNLPLKSRCLSPKILPGDSRRNENAQIHT
jgi:hypothetical protein